MFFGLCLIYCTPCCHLSAARLALKKYITKVSATVTDSEKGPGRLSKEDKVLHCDHCLFWSLLKFFSHTFNFYTNALKVDGGPYCFLLAFSFPPLPLSFLNKLLIRDGLIKIYEVILRSDIDVLSISPSNMNESQECSVEWKKFTKDYIDFYKAQKQAKSNYIV